MSVLTPPASPPTAAPPLGRGRFRPHRRVLAATAALVVGTLATAAGVGIGVRYAQKTGLSVGTVAGVASLVAGLALLGYAVRTGWLMLRRWWRLLLLPAAIVVLQLLLVVGPAFTYAVGPPTALGAGTPADRGMSYTDVTFPTRDGVRLSAWYVPTRNGAAVVVRHGSGSTRTATLAQAAVLARHGYGLLLVDARGHGHSAGRGMDLGWYGDLDTSAAVTFLARQPGVDAGRLAVLGLSMGGEEAIGAAAGDPRIRAVVAEGATQRTFADRQRWAPGNPVADALDRLTYALTDLLTPADQPRALHDAVTASRAPFLLISAGAVADEARAAADLEAAAPDRVETWNVPGAQHTRALAVDPAGWERRVVAFLDQHLTNDQESSWAAQRT